MPKENLEKQKSIEVIPELPVNNESLVSSYVSKKIPKKYHNEDKQKPGDNKVNMKV